MSGVTYVTRDGDCLDLICFRHYGRSSGLVERVLEANYGLAELGPIYPENIEIFLPDLPKPKVRKEINIWE
ncbi:tail protein X [Pseudoalteromonas luteoviolacea]|uniref:Tail protein X n=1 Tax=Pseudoalteromonas luteoviolacea NCIMB 1942 TaxID=1365253 RepID=A0A167I1Y3_9GAMM|nr:tail protein X [Pseudoalteromonas luteoviolacea]KZN58801.1 tail protein X [Pseudoalteromonas luteoviolacea NCIMB 1942]KZW99077.1 tail protein [Pseudoalteromonas luteoviolacea]